MMAVPMAYLTAVKTERHSVARTGQRRAGLMAPYSADSKVPHWVAPKARCWVDLMAHQRAVQTAVRKGNRSADPKAAL